MGSYQLKAFAILIFFLQSCAHGPAGLKRSPSSWAEVGSCSDLLLSLATPEEKIGLHFFGEGFNPLKNAYVSMFKDLQLKAGEAQDLIDLLDELPREAKQRHLLQSAILYSRTLPGDQKAIFRERLPFILSDRFQESLDPEIRAFRRHYTKLSRYREQVERKELSRLQRSDEARTVEPEFLRTKAVDRSFKQTAAYERLYYACRNTVKTPDNPASETKMLTWAITAGGVGSTMATYSVVNWDKEKDANWYKELVFVIGMSLVLNYINGRYILANPSLSPWTQRLPLTMGVVAAQDIGTTALYGLLFSTGDDELLRRLEEIERTGEFDQFKRELLEVIEQNQLFDKHREATEALFARIRPEDPGNLAPLTEAEIEDLRFEDINVDESIHLFLDALAQYEYEQNKGPLSLGSKTYDRYAFHRMLDLGFMPLSILSSLIMYKQICMAPNPKVGMAKAVATFMGAKLFMDALYFYSRRHVIGQ